MKYLETIIMFCPKRHRCGLTMQSLENVHGLMLSWHFIDNVFEDGVIDEMFNAYIKLILSL